MTFEDVMQFTRTISSHTAFENSECEAYFEILMGLPENALIVEVGLEYGRSSSIALQVAKHKNLRYVGIDPFQDVEIYKSWHGMAADTGARFRLVIMKSDDFMITEPIDCILIDGDHSYDAVFGDLNHFAHHVKDGYLLMHDFGRDSLPDVYRAARNYFGSWNRRWEELPTVGTLGIWRRR